MNRDDFKYLSQVFSGKVLNLVKQKGYCPYEYMIDFEKFKKKYYQIRKSFLVHWQVKKSVIKSMSMFLRFRIYFK